MQITVSLLPQNHVITSQTGVAVVIDVLRATSVIATALAAGAARVITCPEVSEAQQLAEAILPRPLLCGERGCKPIAGFDLGNSPAEYARQRVEGKTLVLTTTNGTLAIAATRLAKRVITASFLNLSVAAERLGSARVVHLVCAGTDGHVTAEDVLLAGALVTHCQREYSAVLEGDEAILARQLWNSWFGDDGLPSDAELSKRLRETRGGANLVRLGYQEDLDRCASIDSVLVVPERVGEGPTEFALQAKQQQG